MTDVEYHTRTLSQVYTSPDREEGIALYRVNASSRGDIMFLILGLENKVSEEGLRLKYSELELIQVAESYLDFDDIHNFRPETKSRRKFIMKAIESLREWFSRSSYQKMYLDDLWKGKTSPFEEWAKIKKEYGLSPRSSRPHLSEAEFNGRNR